MVSQQHNPYTPPRETEPPPELEGVWRQGDWLVVSHSAKLPTEWCVKTNEPTTRTGTLWDLGVQYKGWLYTLKFGLKETLYQRRLWRTRIMLASLVVGLPVSAVSVLSDLWFPNLVSDLAAIGALAASICLVLIGFISSVIDLMQISLISRTGKHVFIRGAHPDFLARFPEWPRS